MSFTFAAPWSVPVGLIVAAAVIGIVLLASRSLRTLVDRRTRIALVVLRTAAAVLLLLLLLDPVLSRERLRSESLRVAVLIDRSQSMSILDSRNDLARFRAAADFLTRGRGGLIPRLEEEGFAVDAFAFDTALRTATAFDLEGRSLPTGNLTDIAGALESAGGSLVPRETVSVVLLSDGVDNGGGDAVETAKALKIPVYTVAFGSSDRTREGPVDLAITAVDAPETAFANNTVVAEVGVRSTGYDLSDEAYRKVRLVLTEGETELAGEWVEFKESGIPVRVPFRFVPEGAGPHTYELRIAVRGDEAYPENNRRVFSLKVLERRASVLFYDATMRWEAKFLRDFLARDPATDVTSVLHSGQGRLLVYGDAHGADLSHGLPATREGFAKFDVIVLGDVEAAALEAGSLALLREHVENGGGLLTLGGYNAYGSGGYAGTPLAEVIPFEIREGDGQHESEVDLDLTPEGRVHPVLSGLTGYFTARPRPFLKGLSLVRGTKPGAEALLTALGGDGTRVGTALAAQRYGEGPVVSFAGDTSWVWYRSPEFGGEDGLYRRFWGQILRWLLEREPEVEQAGEPLLLDVARPSYRIGETVRLRARARDEEGKPLAEAAVSASLAGPDGVRPLELLPVPGEPGAFGAELRAKVPGIYTATARLTGGAEGAAEAEFTIEDSSVEMDAVGVNLQLLASIAQASGGRYHELTNAKGIVDDIRGSLLGLMERQELSFSNTPLFFLLFVSLLTAEWLLRRRRNML
jgi:uncharacterized membrane protein